MKAKETEKLKAAARQLWKSERGQYVMRDLAALLGGPAATLDSENQKAFLVLAIGFFNGFSGTVLEVMNEEPDED